MANGFSTKKMQVEMIYDLTAIATAVDQQAVAFVSYAFFFGKLPGNDKHVPYQAFVFDGKVIGRVDMLIRHN